MTLTLTWGWAAFTLVYACRVLHCIAQCREWAASLPRGAGRRLSSSNAHLFRSASATSPLFTVPAQFLWSWADCHCNCGVTTVHTSSLQLTEVVYIIIKKKKWHTVIKIIYLRNSSVHFHVLHKFPIVSQLTLIDMHHLISRISLLRFSDSVSLTSLHTCQFIILIITTLFLTYLLPSSITLSLLHFSHKKLRSSTKPSHQSFRSTLWTYFTFYDYFWTYLSRRFLWPLLIFFHVSDSQTKLTCQLSNAS